MIPGSAWLGRAQNLIEFTTLGSDASTTDTASFVTTDSYTGQATVLQLLSVFNTKATIPDIPTVSQTGATWDQVATVTIGGTIRITVFRQLGVTAAGQLTISFGGNTQTSIILGVTGYSNVDITGTNGSGAIVQSTTNSSDASPSSLTVTLSAFSNLYNAAYGAFGCDTSTPTTIGGGTGFTIVGVNATVLTPNGASASEFKNSNDTSVDCTLTTTTNAVGIAIEIKSIY